jgi:hypothetical protein
MRRHLKRLLPRGSSLRKIKTGIGAGSWMWLDLQHQLQRFLGLDERELAPIVNRALTKASTLVDVGANDGLYTVHFLNSGAKEVLSCEAGPSRERLLANAAANGHEPSSRFRFEERLVGTVETGVPLAELLRSSPQPIFIKIDVDGAEIDALRSCETFANLKQVWWLVEVHSVELERQAIEWFEQHGYKITVVKPAWWRRLIPEKRPLEHNQWLVAESK